MVRGRGSGCWCCSSRLVGRLLGRISRIGPIGRISQVDLVARAPALPDAAVGGFQIPGEAGAIGKGRGRHGCAQGSPELCQPPQVPRQIGCQLGKILRTIGDQAGQPDALQKCRPDPGAVRRAGQRHYRHSHPERLAGRGGAVVGEAVQRDVHRAVELQMFGVTYRVALQLKALGADPLCREEAEESCPAPRVRQRVSLDDHPGTRHAMQRTCPERDGLRRYLGGIVERAKPDRAVGEGGEFSDRGRLLGWCKTGEGPGQPQEPLGMERLRCAGRIADGVGDAVVDGVEPGRMRVAKPGDLDRSGLSDKKGKAVVRGVPREVHQYVDLVPAYQGRRFLVRHTCDVQQAPGEFSEPGAGGVGHRHV